MYFYYYQRTISFDPGVVYEIFKIFEIFLSRITYFPNRIVIFQISTSASFHLQILLYLLDYPEFSNEHKFFILFPAHHALPVKREASREILNPFTTVTIFVFGIYLLLNDIFIS